jgi:hypothetical protein
MGAELQAKAAELDDEVNVSVAGLTLAWPGQRA